MPEDIYADFAARYDRFYPGFGEHDPEVREFFGRLFSENRVGRILDCSCGTGHHLPLFQSLGCRVCGSDVSPSMLRRARENLRGSGLDVPLAQVDYRDLPHHYREPFDAVACLTSSILHMEEESQLARAFASMRGVLRDGGILILTQGMTDGMWKRMPRITPVVQARDFSRVFFIDYIGRGACFHVLDLSHDEQGNDSQVWSVEYPIVWLRDDQERFLRKAGFRSVEFFGSYGFEPYDREASGRLLTVARK